jgi:hypothetical protein
MTNRAQSFVLSWAKKQLGRHPFEGDVPNQGGVLDGFGVPDLLLVVHGSPQQGHSGVALALFGGSITLISRQIGPIDHFTCYGRM